MDEFGRSLLLVAAVAVLLPFAVAGLLAGGSVPLAVNAIMVVAVAVLVVSERRRGDDADPDAE